MSADSLAWPALVVLALWWVSTGAILLLSRVPRDAVPLTMAWAGAVLAAALWGLVRSADDRSAGGAYCAFSCALLVWAWQELAFLLGIVTGPRRVPCTPGQQGWARWREALATLVHHELALLALGVAVWLAVGEGANRTGWHSFVALWAMRQSAKLNLFLGVRNHSEAFLPPHLRYLHSYFRQAAMNPLLPLSLAAGAAATAWHWQAALALPAGSAAASGLALLGTLLALGLLEHAMLVLPVSPEALWRWGLAPRPVAARAVAPTIPPPTRGLP